ncbi:MAG: hypothetical protein Q9157_005694 [Trypethelium eluteriae]
MLPSSSNLALLAAFLFIVSCVNQSCVAHPARGLSQLDPISQLEARSPQDLEERTSLPNQVVPTRIISKYQCPVGAQCNDGDDADENGSNDDDEGGEESDKPDTEYEPSDFEKSPEKAKKVERTKKRQKPDGKDIFCKSNENPCYGECCDKQSEHCSPMAVISQTEGMKYSTCVAIGKRADRNGKACEKAKMSDGPVENVPYWMLDLVVYDSYACLLTYSSQRPSGPVVETTPSEHVNIIMMLSRSVGTILDTTVSAPEQQAFHIRMLAIIISISNERSLAMIEPQRGQVFDASDDDDSNDDDENDEDEDEDEDEDDDDDDDDNTQAGEDVDMGEDIIEEEVKADVQSVPEPSTSRFPPFDPTNRLSNCLVLTDDPNSTKESHITIFNIVNDTVVDVKNVHQMRRNDIAQEKMNLGCGEVLSMKGVRRVQKIVSGVIDVLRDGNAVLKILFQNYQITARNRGCGIKTRKFDFLASQL